MDVFEVRDKVIEDYRSFTTASIDIKDARLKDHYQQELDGNRQWPEPWLSLNPAFETGGRVDELVRDGLLDPECERIFRVKRHIEDAGDVPITLHRHQRDAVEVAQSGKSYVLTTGTGSGKSLAYIVPIVDYVLKQPRVPGVKAIIIYPMNALANSQLGELEKFLTYGYGSGREQVTYVRYTGQEQGEERDRMSSLVFDFVTRQKVGGTHMTYGYLTQLATPRPETAPPWRAASPRWFTCRASFLQSAASWTVDRAGVIAELDAACFHVFGKDRDEAAYILDSFPILKRRDESAWGHYQTKRLVLEAYDAMQAAVLDGEPYLSPFDAELSAASANTVS